MYKNTNYSEPTKKQFHLHRLHPMFVYLRRLLVSILLCIQVNGVTYAVSDTSSEYSEHRVKVTEAWVREVPPTASVTALFMTLENSGGAMHLLEVNSQDFARVEIHQTIMKDGFMRMVKQSHLSLPSNTKVILQPRGMHVMLFNPSDGVLKKKTLNFILVFSDGSEQKITAMVKFE